MLLGALAAIRTQGHVPGLLFVDGHEDAYAPHESPTGETADMEYGFAGTPALKERFPLVRARDAILIAHRDAAVIKEDPVAL